MTASPLRRAAQPFVSVAKWYTNCAKQHPVVTAILTSGVKTSAADLFAQKASAAERHKAAAPIRMGQSLNGRIER